MIRLASRLALLVGLVQLVPPPVAPVNVRVAQGIPSTSATQVTITAPTSSATYDAGTAATLTTLAGTAKANKAISACTWTNSLGGSGSATGTATWTIASVALTVGTNVITVTCPNAGGTGTDVISVTRSGVSEGTQCTDAQTGGTARYVREGATGSGTGLDWTNAHTDLPTLVRGRTYCVADGDYGPQTFNIAESGSTLITVKKATVADHGTSTGWSDTYGDGQAVWNLWLFDSGSGYYWLDGASRSAIDAGHGFKINNTDDCATELINVGPSGGTPSNNLTFRYIEIAGRGYDAAPCSEFWGDRAFYTNATTGNGVTDVLIQYCYLYEMYVPFLTRQAQDWTIEYTYIRDTLSSAAAHAETWSDTGTDNVIFRYNILKNPEGTASIAILNGGGTTTDDGNTSTNWQIYGNVWYQQGYSPTGAHTSGIAGIIYCAHDGSNNNYCDQWLFFNNVIHNFDTGTAAARLFFESVTGVTAPIARNNMWSSNASNATHNNVTLTHNWYWTTTHTSDASNEQSGSGDPFVNAAAGNFHLTGATTAGSSTSQPAGNTTDPDGVTRGGDGTADRGAFEYTAGLPLLLSRRK